MKDSVFYKLQASGNDFIVLDRLSAGKTSQKSYSAFARKYCRRKLGIGADGVLVIEPSLQSNSFKMRIFNPDGSEAEMCGNGARCAALWYGLKNSTAIMSFDTKAGVIQAEINSERDSAEDSSRRVKVNMSSPSGLSFDLPILVCGRSLNVNSINTGVPHAVIFVEGLENIDVNLIGREVRFHEKFKPRGTNVNFVEISGADIISVRTYERGVESETLACGTGSVASAVISVLKFGLCEKQETKAIKVRTGGGEILSVYFTLEKDKIVNVFLEGQAHLIYEGTLKT